MKTKTINSVITKKINDWLSTIDDQEVVKKIKNNIIVTGGCITSMLLNEEVNDFDIYFRNKETAKIVAEYYCKKFNENNKDKKPFNAFVLDGQDVEDWKNGLIKLEDFASDYAFEVEDSESSDLTDFESYPPISTMITNCSSDRIKIIVKSDGIASDNDEIADQSEYDIEEYIENVSELDEIDSRIMNSTTKEKYKPIFLSTNAITLSDKVQLIIRFYGEPEEIHKNYDFVHTTNYWDSKDKQVVLNNRALEAILNKELFYIGSKYPIASMIRTRKFIKRGWQINAGQYLKIAFQISELDLTDINVLEDQLVGVDSIYFISFIDKLKEMKLKNNSFKIDQSYIVSVIDKIFG